VLSAYCQSIHNITFYLTMMAEIRQSIADNRFMAYKGILQEYLGGEKQGKAGKG